MKRRKRTLGPSLPIAELRALSVASAGKLAWAKDTAADVGAGVLGVANASNKVIVAAVTAHKPTTQPLLSLIGYVRAHAHIDRGRAKFTTRAFFSLSLNTSC